MTARTDNERPGDGSGAAPTRRPSVSFGRGWYRDIVAGVSVALVLVPQSLAYAEIAGVPPYIGLYAAAFPPVAAAFFASSRFLQTGPVAMTSLLTFGVLSSLAEPETSRYVLLAAVLAVLVGVVRIGLGVVRAGVVAYFMSQPVVLGFTSAAALLITATQVPTALGSIPPDGRLLYRASWAITHVGSWEPSAVALSVLTILVVVAGRRLHPLFPGVLVAVVIGIVYSSATGYEGSVIGDVPTGLPSFLSEIPWSDLPSLLVPAVVIALVGFAEPASIARTFAAQDRERWSPDRELIGQGVANIASGLVGAFPVGGSFSRSSLNRLAGGVTRWSGAITGLAVLAFLPAADVVSPLPRAVLAGIVIGAVAKLIHIVPLFRLFRYSKPQALVALLTFVATLVLSPRIDIAVLLGIAAGIVIHLWRELRIRVDTTYADGVLHMHPRGVLFFASAPYLDEELTTQLAAHPEATSVVLELERLGRIDYTGALALKSVVEGAEQAGLHVELRAIPPHARRVIHRVWEGGLGSPPAEP